MSNRNDTERLATEYNFIRDTMEKVMRLCTILEFVSSDMRLSQDLALKGGTAINLLVMPISRLSVDIDLDFTDNCDRQTMLRQRKVITNRLQSYMLANGYRLMPRSKSPFSIDSWVFQYTNSAGNLDNIKIEINYSMRCHLLPMQTLPIQLPMFASVKVRTLTLVELYASKIKALLERGAARDLFDVHNMIQSEIFDETQKPMLRKGVIFYSAVGGNNKPSVPFSLEAIERLNFKQIRSTLLPVLKKGTFYDLETVKHSVCDYLKDLLKLTENEQLFITLFNDNDYCPELLFEDTEIVERIRKHPMAIWKTSKGNQKQKQHEKH